MNTFSLIYKLKSSETSTELNVEYINIIKEDLNQLKKPLSSKI